MTRSLILTGEINWVRMLLSILLPSLIACDTGNDVKMPPLIPHRQQPSLHQRTEIASRKKKWLRLRR